MRTIDADPISKHLSIVIKHNIDKDLSYTKERLFKLMIDNAPTIDAEPVVRCKDCVRNADNGGVYSDGRTRCPIQEHYKLLNDGYCHLGERKDKVQE